jgi:hypothetical protein
MTIVWLVDEICVCLLCMGIITSQATSTTYVLPWLHSSRRNEGAVATEWCIMAL